MGNGQSISIWDDAWIPTCANRKTVTPKGRLLLSTVVDLIDPVMNCWDEDLITQTMWPIYAQRILSIPLPQNYMPDFIAWSHTKKGYLN